MINMKDLSGQKNCSAIYTYETLNTCLHFLLFSLSISDLNLFTKMPLRLLMKLTRLHFL